jgi:hypothetical protein
MSIRTSLRTVCLLLLVVFSVVSGSALGQSCAGARYSAAARAPIVTTKCDSASRRDATQGASRLPARLPSKAPLTPAVELTASDGVAGNALGTTVAISGGTVVVGEDCLEIGSNPNCSVQNQGIAYVYQKPSSGWSNMAQTAELTPSDGQTGDEFGLAVAVSGDTIVVGSGTGKVYVFVKPLNGWTNMTETAQLTDGMTGDCFGCAVAIDQQTIVVGAAVATINGNGSQGAAYVFVEPATGWATTSNYAAQLTASDGTFEDLFGISVGISGNTIVAGAPFYQDRTGPGAAYVFVKPASGWSNMTQTAELTKTEQGLYDEFGLSVAIAGNTIAVGAPQAEGNGNSAGAAYVFVEPAAGWANATQTAQLLASSATQNFGFSMATSGNKVVVGTFSGTSNSVFVYAKPKGGWTSTSDDSLTIGRGDGFVLFGLSVAVAGDVVAAGAPYLTVKGQPDQGAAFVVGN